MKARDIQRAMEDLGPTGMIRALLRYLDENCPTKEARCDLILGVVKGARARGFKDAAGIVRKQQGAFDPAAVADLLDAEAAKVCDLEASRQRIREMMEEE